ncbi:MAG TPA: nucleotidyltransferase domain-containing protein [Chitinophagales bacterium]|nr:nucleotidyltransferase domain-containing protein [Chitinophagales bacterium]
MLDKIQNALNEISTHENVKILFACESGSRAWGFASPDSDYDVRFVYVQPKEYYLSIDERKDVIELPVNEILDVSGWDVRKALRLFRGSNAVIYEWLQSPIVYLSESGFQKNLWSMAPDYFSLRAGMHHYLSMSINTFQNELQTDEVKLKKYFYALRPILACKWISEKHEVPPMVFQQLLKVIQSDKKIVNTIDALLEMKNVSDEKKIIARNDRLNEFIQNEIQRCDEIAKTISRKEVDSQKLNEFFKGLVES